MAGHRKKRPMTVADQQRVQRWVESAPFWKDTSAPEYDSCPHQYINFLWPRPRRCKTAWKAIHDAIGRFGQMKTWRGARYRYLRVNGWVYWSMFPVLNRADASRPDMVALFK